MALFIWWVLRARLLPSWDLLIALFSLLGFVLIVHIRFLEKTNMFIKSLVILAGATGVLGKVQYMVRARFNSSGDMS